MTTEEKTQITVETDVNASVEKAWKIFTTPEDLIQWNNASDDWHTTKSENDLRPGGKFLARMEAKDGSFGFDFGGTYDDVIPHALISYTMGDGRRVQVNFTADGNRTKVVETFEAEGTHSIEMQRSGWQSILDNYKRYAESK
jgi:uncharacterized protein YndB with AHSA1/START domain